MKWSFRVVSCVAVCAIAAMVLVQARPAAASGGQTEDEAKMLMKADEAWSDAAKARDLERAVSFYAENVVVYPPGSPVVRGRAEARKVWTALLSDPSFTLSWKPESAEVSGDLGFTAGFYELSMKSPDGATIQEKGKTLCVWKKQKDGSWKAWHDMWNSDSK